MADLASSAVVVNRTESRTRSDGLVMFTKHCTVTLTGQGTTTNKIPATALGLSSIEEVSNLVKTDDTLIIPAGPSNDRTAVLLADAYDATATNHATPADETGAFNFVVKGF